MAKTKASFSRLLRHPVLPLPFSMHFFVQLLALSKVRRWCS